VLFLYRPRQTWMPFVMPRNRTQQDAYRRQQQSRFEAGVKRPPGRTPAPPAPPAEGAGDRPES
jgi:hypothetical protein